MSVLSTLPDLQYTWKCKVRNKNKKWTFQRMYDENERGEIVPHLTETVIRKIKTNSSYTMLLFCGLCTSLFYHLVLVMTLWVRSISALLDLFTSSSSLSGKDSIASAARFACFIASSLAFWMPRLLPRYSRACIFRRLFLKWTIDSLSSSLQASEIFPNWTHAQHVIKISEK